MICATSWWEHPWRCQTRGCSTEASDLSLRPSPDGPWTKEAMGSDQGNIRTVGISDAGVGKAETQALPRWQESHSRSAETPVGAKESRLCNGESSDGKEWRTSPEESGGRQKGSGEDDAGKGGEASCAGQEDRCGYG
jgi:hypothetical protein